MKEIAIVYASIHHKNTEKLLQGMTEGYDIDLIDILDNKEFDLSNYQAVGFASGIYLSKFHKSLYGLIEEKVDIPKKSFVVYTSGVGNQKYGENFSNYLKENGFEVLGVYQCKGYDTYGLLRFIGGVAKGHPNEDDIENGKLFIQDMVTKV